jgi:hypothetical protein
MSLFICSGVFLGGLRFVEKWKVGSSIVRLTVNLLSHFTENIMVSVEGFDPCVINRGIQTVLKNENKKSMVSDW